VALSETGLAASGEFAVGNVVIAFANIAPASSGAMPYVFSHKISPDAPSIKVTSIFPPEGEDDGAGFVMFAMVIKPTIPLTKASWVPRVPVFSKPE
jgi:hypothetical protein